MRCFRPLRNPYSHSAKTGAPISLYNSFTLSDKAQLYAISIIIPPKIGCRPPKAGPFIRSMYCRLFGSSIIVYAIEVTVNRGLIYRILFRLGYYIESIFPAAVAYRYDPP